MSFVRDIRCLGKGHKLFGKLDVEDRMIEFGCQDCRKAARQQRPEVTFVLHRYRVDTGEFVETVWRIGSVEMVIAEEAS